MIPTFAISTTSDTSTLKRMCSQGFTHVFCKVIFDCFENVIRHSLQERIVSECSKVSHKETFNTTRVDPDIE
jgi:hypothetical protein